MLGAPSTERLGRAVDGKVVLVTGASAGTGRATARALGAAGATVLLVARSQDKLDVLAAQIAADGGTAHVLATDLGDVDAAHALGETILERYGGVDVVVNNAGLSIRRSIELSYDRFHDFDRTIRINYLGPVRLLLTLLPAMRERGDGHIVNVSTVGVRLPDAPRYTAYLASKGAFDIWLRGVAPEVRGDGIACTSMYFGLVHTRMSGATSLYHYIPGLTPERAAADVCWAIIDRPTTTGPVWAKVGGLAADAARGGLEPVLSRYYRLSTDSARARGETARGGLEIPALERVSRLAGRGAKGPTAT
jgi:NAD(P)-dependent dehydrogenase (short-subunit alcohol dehydrogenase family)